jgi:hypothetical protein
MFETTARTMLAQMEAALCLIRRAMVAEPEERSRLLASLKSLCRHHQYDGFTLSFRVEELLYAAECDAEQEPGEAAAAIAAEIREGQRDEMRRNNEL